MNDLIIFFLGGYAQPAERKEEKKSLACVSVWLFPLGVMGQLVITTEGKRSPAEKDTTKHKRGEKRERPRCGFYEPRLSSNNSPFTCDPNVDFFFTWVERKEDDPNSMVHLR